MSAPAEGPAWYLKWESQAADTIRRSFGDHAADTFADIPEGVRWTLRYELQIAFMRSVLAGLNAVLNGNPDDAVANAQAVYREHQPSARGVTSDGS